MIDARAVIGIASRSPEAARRVVDELAPESVNGPHAVLLRTITDLVNSGAHIDPLVVQAAVLDQPDHTTQDALNELAEAVACSPADVSLGWHLERLADGATLIRAQALADTARQMAEEGTVDLDLLRERFDRIGHTRASTTPTLADMLDLYLPQMDEPADTRCQPTGLADLDRLLNGGMRPGQLLVVGARPGVGKSVMLLALARHAAIRCGQRVLMASMEMSTEEVFWRFVAAETRTDLAQHLARSLDPQAKEKVWDAFHRLAQGHVHVVDAGSQSIRDIATSARAHRPALIVVDYLQQLRPGDERVPRQEQVSQMSRALKVLAKDLDCPVLVAAQLNRGQTQRTDPRPRMSDLRESGAIEADADVVMLLHRDPDDDSFGTTAELIVAKNRSGPTGSVDLVFEGHYATLNGAYRG